MVEIDSVDSGVGMGGGAVVLKHLTFEMVQWFDPPPSPVNIFTYDIQPVCKEQLWSGN